MIALDEQQDRLLRDISEIAGRAAADRTLRRLRRIATTTLSLWRVLMPRHFERWNRDRIAQQQHP